MFEKGGTCCPTCGTRQPHTHLGWLKPKEVLFTQVSCEKCGNTSLIIRFIKEQSSDTYHELDEAIRKIFEKRR